MKVALVHPHDMKYHKEREIMNAVSHVEGYENFPDLGLLSIASLFGKGWEIKYIDEDYLARNNLPRSYLDEEFDLVCLTAMNHQAYQAYRIVDHFRSRGVYTVMGGMHASALPDEAGENVDTVIVGEGEIIFRDFIKDFMWVKPKKMYRAKGNADLKSFQPPDYEIVENIEWYNKYPIFATRGCPRNCDFCCLGEVYGHKYRKKNPSQVVNEIENLKMLVPSPFISFADENMMIDKKWSKELANALKPLNIKWEAYCDVSVAEDEELLQLLRESGCVELIIGFETIDPRNLEKTEPWKAEKIKTYSESIRKIESHEIGVLACFVVGFDYDDKDTFKRLRDFLYENPVFELDIAVLTPMPGTRLHARLKKEGRLFQEKWDNYTWYHVNFEPQNLTPDEIKDGIKWVFDEYEMMKQKGKKKELYEKIASRLPDMEGRN